MSFLFFDKLDECLVIGAYWVGERIKMTKMGTKFNIMAYHVINTEVANKAPKSTFPLHHF